MKIVIPATQNYTATQEVLTNNFPVNTEIQYLEALSTDQEKVVFSTSSFGTKAFLGDVKGQELTLPSNIASINSTLELQHFLQNAWMSIENNEVTLHGLALAAGTAACGAVAKGSGAGCALVAGGAGACGAVAKVVGGCGAVSSGAGGCGVVGTGAGACGAVGSGQGATGAGASGAGVCGQVACGAKACGAAACGTAACAAVTPGVCGIVGCVATPIGCSLEY